MKFRIQILRIFAVCALGALAFPALSWARTQTVLTGRTMGTFYRITLVTAQPLSRALWQKKIDIRLKEVNAHLSMYQPDSELSRFNKAPGNTPFPVSRDFFTVILQCQDLYQITNGAWDGTVKPLVDLWGFGTQKQPKRLPDPALIRSALGRTGFDTLRLDGQVLTKTREGVTLDLGSIAKGYGVDEIARLISEAGISDFLVEIGGELVASGRNKKGKLWTVGISRPDKKQLAPGFLQVVSLDHMAVATSGNYRNFYEKDGQFFSHIIDPSTGFPVKNQVVSASVIARTCTRADGLATALMVMDIETSLELINRLPRTECLIVKKKGNKLFPYRSEGFKHYER